MNFRRTIFLKVRGFPLEAGENKGDWAGMRYRLAGHTLWLGNCGLPEREDKIVVLCDWQV